MSGPVDPPLTLPDHRRSKRLGHARAALVNLPDMLDDLARCLTERDPNSGGHTGKISGSPAPLRLEVLHLTDTRRKPGWEGEDPRLQQLADRYGAAATLESWTRVVVEELAEPPEMAEYATVRSECSVLLEVWGWITDQQWADELAQDVLTLHGRVRAALGIRPEYQPRCRYCRSPVRPVEAETHGRTTWEACAFGLCSGCGATYPKGAALDALGQVQDPQPLKVIAEMVGIPVKTLHRWVLDGVITPAPGPDEKRRGRLYDLAQVQAVSRIRNRT